MGLSRGNMWCELRFTGLDQLKKRIDRKGWKLKKNLSFSKDVRVRNNNANPLKRSKPLIKADDTVFELAFFVLYIRERRLFGRMLSNVAMLRYLRRGVTWLRNKCQTDRELLVTLKYYILCKLIGSHQKLQVLLSIAHPRSCPLVLVVRCLSCCRYLHVQ